MDSFIINGRNKIYGSVKIDKAKNALLPIIAASVAVGGKCFLEDYPEYSDTNVMLEIVRGLGGEYKKVSGGVLIDTSNINTGRFPAELFKSIRASVFMLGAVISRCGYAEAVLPGGCSIGERPIDMHLKGLEALGVRITADGDRIRCDCKKLKGGNIDLPFPSVGVTENLIIAASVADGTTVIKNAAREPEVSDLIDFINLSGGRIRGRGRSVIEIEGVKRLKGVSFKPVPDRIETGTFMLATMLLGGEIEINDCNLQNILSIINKTENSACKIYSFNDKIYIKAKGTPSCVGKINVSPYPGFPTDAQSQTVAMLSVAEGESRLTDNVFPHRFGYVSQLNRLGADVRVLKNTAVINGVSGLHGAEVFAEDLRGGAGIVLACLKAEGRSVVHGVRHIDRGYCRFEEKLRGLGLDIIRM